MSDEKSKNIEQAQLDQKAVEKAAEQVRLGLHASHEPEHVPIDMKPRSRREKPPLEGVSDPRVKRARGDRKPGPLRRSIKLDAVHPADFRVFNCRFFCDDCSHYSFIHKVCTIGFVPQHTREEQMKIYNITGKIAFCRFIEID